MLPEVAALGVMLRRGSMGRRARGRAIPATSEAARATLLAVALLATACSTSHVARPLGRGNAVGQASLGGPLVEVSETPIAAPILSLGGGYGLSDQWDGYARADVTAAAYGTLHLEPGVAFHPLVREAGGVPTVTVAASAHVLTDLRELRLGPQLTALAAWRVGATRRHLVYVGVDAGTLVPGRVRVLAGPLAGAELRVGRRSGLALEVKWLSPWYDVGPLSATWISPGNRGYLAILLGYNLYWGDVR
jgi:hypothetical protein